MNGRSIRMFLPEGTPGSLFTAEIVNWTGRVTVFPRSELKEFLKRGEAQQPGVYVLLGQRPEAPEQDQAYIGESEGLGSRLKTHNNDDKKDFWETTFVLSSKDANLTKAHVRYLEARLVQTAMAAERVPLVNGTLKASTALTPLPEADQSDMEYFLSQALLVLPVVGFNGVRPKITRRSESAVAAQVKTPGDSVPAPAVTGDTQFFVLQSGNVNARAIESGDEFVVLKGSTARREPYASWMNYKPLRAQIEQDGHLQVDPVDPSLLTFTDDVPFRSVSAAGAVVLARNTNGRKEWKHEGTGLSYGEWKAKQLESLTSDSDVDSGDEGNE
ncbi:GIY-YIG nuclease family protein [Deinococcus sp. ME38]|uniref:GIY-YIG nuclease family protein n=1 Tax=Deinococcus sp. ME38 TaxID=3400344 RepID=UPI003B5C1A8F